jgi:DNA (cytosine-5)-methyltransferase 1
MSLGLASTSHDTTAHGQGLSVAGLFAGIGGIEVGLHAAGHETVLLCEIDEAARGVLVERFASTPLVGDVRELSALPEAELCAAGFPCQDLSQAGRTAGIQGAQSGLVSEVFRLLRESNPRWLLLENVPFMLQLDRGEAMRFLTRSLERLGFRWAYRIVDARAFGLPQRRQRVLLLASRSEDPREVLFVGDDGEPTWPDPTDVPCGFYWTEGSKGLGWAVDAVPTLKGGSTIGIPSPPAIRFPDGFIGVPEIRDAERLQGFPADWTAPAVEGRRRQGVRWKLVGNAVNVRVARWLGERLLSPRSYNASEDDELPAGNSWPKAAWGADGKAWRANVSVWPAREPYEHLLDFLEYEVAPLSARATEGFLRRARKSTLRFAPGFLEDVEAHLDRARESALFAA